ncbi:hypothetical protein QA649_37480 [Bradyrhizobium sp. CB1717]|uniref:hypothetical protein n=1 Tax=Bradyrhizobium sp. CB1717 TaxID=3039154 RepID=UPI0024B15DEA|nr:hypothetical protein [Bradyrhizobium sp. CB1717]WFU23645.1 hypothetical protein QA649_37480 [Bradyrhizobium sp. CB1717]
MQSNELMTSDDRPSLDPFTISFMRMAVGLWAKGLPDPSIQGVRKADALALTTKVTGKVYAQDDSPRPSRTSTPVASGSAPPARGSESDMPLLFPHPCEGLPASARKAFDVAAAGAEPKAAKKTLSLLVERGLLARHARQHFFNDRLPPMVSYVYSVPIAHHLAWCQHWAAPRAPTARRRRRSRRAGDDEPTLF